MNHTIRPTGSPTGPAAGIVLPFVVLVAALGCSSAGQPRPTDKTTPRPRYSLTKDQTHNRFSSSVVEVWTEEATDGQITHTSTAETVRTLDFGPYATTLDEAVRKATRHMIEYLVTERGMARNDAYVLCSLAGDLKIAEVVDVPHVLVAMHIPKRIFRATR